MGRGSSGRTIAASASTPEWREAFRSGTDFIESGDVDHDRRRVSYELQSEWDRFTREYQDGVTDRDMRDLMKEFDPRTGSVYGYVRTTNSFRINEKLYDPANAGKTDEEIFTRTDRRGELRDLQTVRTLDKLINNHQTAADATYTRFTKPDSVQSSFGLSREQLDNLMRARSMTPAQLRTLNRALAGKTSYSAAYTSTSANRSMNAFGNLRDRPDTIFERKLYMPGGTKAYAVGRNAQESEVIFGRHANTRLMKITIASDGHIVLHEMFTGYRRR